MPENGNPGPFSLSRTAQAVLAHKLGVYGDMFRAFMLDTFPDRQGMDGFYGMMKYHLGWVDQDFRPRDSRTGKSLRPGLCMLVAEGLGAALEIVAPFAAGIELLHNFSLIHDDIQDQSATRRGRPTVWTIWGSAQAINAGDALFSIAHAAWLRSNLAESDPLAYTSILRSLEQTVLRLCEGQYLDMNGEGSVDISSDAYLAMIGRKTAALIGEAAWVGARVVTTDRDILDAVRDFGVELGLAFQIRDDLLGIWGDELETGKSTSTDIAARKMTLPVIVAIENGPPEVREELRACYGAVTDIDDARVRALLVRANAPSIASAHEDRHWQSAMRALDTLPISLDWRALIQEFARSFVGRRA
jgi:geranylgeranyl diphosphate synthase, type I